VLVLVLVFVVVCGAGGGGQSGVGAADVRGDWVFAVAIGHGVKGVGDKGSEAAGSL